jgi:uncharacterized protein (DUF488 family)
MKIYTLGVYGTKEAEFFRKLLDNGVDVFCDIRARRAVRGADYAFANAARLEAKLGKLKIAYLPAKELAAPPDIQKRQNKSMPRRTSASANANSSALYSLPLIRKQSRIV